MKRVLFAMILFILSVPMIAQAQSFEFSVEHEHTLWDCRGKLLITADKIEYQTPHKEDARVWQYQAIRQIKVVSPTKLEITSYEDQKRLLGRDRIFKFKLLDGQITPEISTLFVKKTDYPVATSVIPETAEPPKYELAVKHLHTFGGCEGFLKIYSDQVVYQSTDKAEKSRYWQWGDIQSISRSGAYRFSLSSFERHFAGQTKTFNFELKERMEEVVYDYLWGKINKVTYPLPSGQEK
ncbi:MAG: hypothetical protein AB1757_10660 [Acidobacteriota bacterium]